jgi:hypothetical protein
VFDADFTRVAKLAGSFTESSSNAATVTINTAGDLGARISGARDLYQGTTLKMALLSTGSDGRNVATFDGSNDYMRAAPYSLSQPTTASFVGSQVTWSGGDTVFDGNAIDTGHLQQDTATPRLRVYAGTSLSDIRPAVGDRFCAIVVFNDAASSIRLNRAAATVGAAGNRTMGGFTLGCGGGASSVFANMTFCEADIFSAAQSEGTQLRVATFMGRKWAFAV